VFQPPASGTATLFSDFSPSYRSCPSPAPGCGDGLQHSRFHGLTAGVASARERITGSWLISDY